MLWRGVSLPLTAGGGLLLVQAGVAAVPAFSLREPEWKAGNREEEEEEEEEEEQQQQQQQQEEALFTIENARGDGKPGAGRLEEPQLGVEAPRPEVAEAFVEYVAHEIRCVMGTDGW